ncbi:N-acetylmuramoyl-L-alanine amidase family protein [Arenibacter certesii]|uniref:N-acetylmuramoyl-L-alanine amidase n=1 Tax=Arenibacter certesii TaxID=228955 RepID=A0A918IX83_9FLAO|nr:N-acetylmuramoyl-L-alanine amidase [Arenibacter certesii]GGW36520.1 N-acetylmuramoyl-L-alanine amidase [Arenibacter certesii]
MFRPNLTFSFLITILIFGYPFTLYPQIILHKKKVIIIDPGHGGIDSGTTGENRIVEKDVVFKIAKKMVYYNRYFPNNAFEIYLTRSTDTLISLGDRAKLVKKLNADLFISLHCNHSENPNAKGIEAYVSKSNGQNTKEAIYLAYSLQEALSKDLGYIGRGVKFANFKVLRETSEHVPSVLMELGYLSNRDEAMYMDKEVNIHAIALTILQSLNHYKMIEINP